MLGEDWTEESFEVRLTIQPTRLVDRARQCHGAFGVATSRQFSRWVRGPLMSAAGYPARSPEF